MRTGRAVGARKRPVGRGRGTAGRATRRRLDVTGRRGGLNWRLLGWR